MLTINQPYNIVFIRNRNSYRLHIQLLTRLQLIERPDIMYLSS
ncbi:hypothetical protein P308_01700 [Pseudomonas piscis]|nr:hypothetical protein P308_01700 [Pseudomonas piscis]